MPRTLSSQALEALDLKEKDLRIYTILIELGSAPLRRIAEATKLNRGTTYDALKRLMEKGLVRYVDARSHRYFTGEDPKKLLQLARAQERKLLDAQEEVQTLLPELQKALGRAEHRPAVRYFEHAAGVREILEDVLATTVSTREKTYRVYSSPAIRKLIANSWEGFNQARIKQSVHVKAIATGAGGTTIGLDERRWLPAETNAPTYIFIYGHKTAYVAIDANNQLFGVTIEDQAIADTQRLIFEQLWLTLPVR